MPIDLTDYGPMSVTAQPIPAAVLLPLAIAQEQSHALVVLDVSGRVVSWLGAAHSLFGYQADEMLGQTLERLYTAEDVRRGDVAWGLDAANAHGKTQDDRWHVRKDGVRVWTSGTTTALRDTRGGIVGYAKITRDRTALRAQMENLQDGADQAPAPEDKHVVFGMLAHELRNPLGELANAANVIGAIPSTDLRVDTCVRIIGRQVSYIQNIIHDLLETTREAVGKGKLHYDTFDLRTLVERAAETCGAALEARAQTLDIVFATPVTLEADPVGIQQVLVNLIANSCKFSPPGSRVCVHVAVEGAEVVLRVTDTGQGISPEILPRIFELFAQAEGEGDRAGDGLGLGLGIVKSIVDMHGGSVHARSAGPGKGSEMTVCLPRRRS